MYNRTLNPIVSIKHTCRVILQMSRLGILLRPFISAFIHYFAQRYFDGKYFFSGSFYTKDWIPFVSDIDMNIVGVEFTENQKKIKKILFYLSKYTRIDINTKVAREEIEEITYRAGLYYHLNSPWKSDELAAKRRNLWLCMREISYRYPLQASSSKNFVYIPMDRHKKKWIDLAEDIGVKHLAESIISEESLSLRTRLSAKSCRDLFWKNYFIKFQIIQSMPNVQVYFGQNQENKEPTLIIENDRKFKACTFLSAEGLRNYYTTKTNLFPFPEAHSDLYAYLPKIGLTTIQIESQGIPSLAILQWTLESLVVFYDCPYLYKFDALSEKKLKECIYLHLPRLNKILNNIDTPVEKNFVLTDQIIRDQYSLAEMLLRQAIQLNNLIT